MTVVAAPERRVEDWGGLAVRQRFVSKRFSQGPKPIGSDSPALVKAHLLVLGAILRINGSSWVGR